MEIVRNFILGGSKITADDDCSHEIKRCLLLGKKKKNLKNLAYQKAETLLCHQRSVYSKLWFFQESCMNVRVGPYKDGWVPNNWFFWTVVLEKTLESPLDCKEMQPANSEGNKSWIFIGGSDAKAETPILWPPDAKNWLIWKDPDAGKDWRWEEMGTTEDEMVGWHHQLNRHDFE